MRYAVLNSCVTFACTVSTQNVIVRHSVTMLFTLKRFASLFFKSSMLSHPSQSCPRHTVSYVTPPAVFSALALA